MNCTLAQAGLGQQTVALCSISRCRVTVTGAQSLSKTYKKPCQYWQSWEKKSDESQNWTWYYNFSDTKLLSFLFQTQTDAKRAMNMYLLGKVVFCFSIQCTFPQIGHLLMKSFALALLLSLCIGHQGYVKFQVLLGPSIHNICAQFFFKRRHCKTLFFIH